MATFPRRRRIYEACSCMPSYILACTRVKAFTYTYLNVVQCCPLRTHVGQDTEGALRFLKTHFIFVFFPFFFLIFFFFFSAQRTFEKAQDEEKTKMTVPLESAMTRVCSPKKLVFKSNCCFPF